MQGGGIQTPYMPPRWAAGIGVVILLDILILQYWKDTLLKWKPADYGGITAVRIPVSKIWQPDIMNYYG